MDIYWERDRQMETVKDRNRANPAVNVGGKNTDRERPVVNVGGKSVNHIFTSFFFCVCLCYQLEVGDCFGTLQKIEGKEATTRSV